MPEAIHEPNSGSLMTFEKSGTAVAPHVYNIGPAGTVTTGSEAFVYYKSGTDWSAATYTPSGGQSYLNVMVDRVGGAGAGGSESYLFGKSGTDYYPLLVGSDADGGILRTSTSVDSVFQASGNVYIVSGADIGVTGSVAVTTNPVFTTPSGNAIPGFVSTDNSTASTLSANGSFFGTGEDISDYSTVTVTIFADESSASNGMTFQFSTDNTNWDDVYNFNLTSGTTSSTRSFQLPSTAQYFRIGYTNGAAGQGAFRLQTMFHPTAALTTVHRIGDVITADRHASLMKSVLTAQKPNTDFTPIDATAAGNLKVSIEEMDTIGSVLVTNPVSDIFMVSGNAWAGVGSVYNAGGSVTVPSMLGSVAVTNTVPVNAYVVSGTTFLTDSGSPGFKEATVVSSGTYSEVWTLANAGSRLELHGFDISSSVAGLVRILLSGGTPEQLTKFWMPASGTVVRNFVSPITPGGAGVDIGVGVAVAGSIEVTIYGREVT